MGCEIVLRSVRLGGSMISGEIGCFVVCDCFAKREIGEFVIVQCGEIEFTV